MKFLFILIASGLLLTSCGSSRVNYDYDLNKDFSTYKSFNFYPSMNSRMSQLDEERIMRNIETYLQSRGFVLSDSPDFYVNFYGNQYTQNSNAGNIGVGVGSGGRRSGIGISGGIPIRSSKLKEELVIDIIDTGNKTMIWNAIYNSSVPTNSPEAKNAYYREKIAKMLSNFPPKKK